MEERIADCSAIMFDINNIEFDNPASLHIEIGCGKGKFIIENALRNPEINYIAVEREETVILSALESAMEYNLPNLRFIADDIAKIAEHIGEGTVDRICLNFSDPWRKTRHHKRRLTHKKFLDIYKKMLKSSGAIHMKTDNDELFDFSIESFVENGFEVKNLTRDLHQSDLAQTNIKTEYETKFSEKGIKIKYAEAYV